MSTLQELRESLAQAKADFESRKKFEWELEAKTWELQIAAEVRRMYDDGMSKSAIMRAYGTSDFRTVDNLLKKTPSKGTRTRPKWTNNDDGTWTVTDGKDAATVIPLHEEKDLFVENGKLPEGITYTSLPRETD